MLPIFNNDAPHGRYKMKLTLAILAFCLFPIAARAEVDVTTLLANYDAASPDIKPIIAKVVEHTQNGISWANQYFVTIRKQKPLYCLPGELTLTGEQVIDILRRELKEPSLVAKQPFGLGIILAFQKVYPCNKQPPVTKNH